ncbi:MAG TPA: Uma2 family endonuclease [Gemmatimonadaceae bacterium]|nr:Uma2 family endonuclease [Gemmatimonadaceae bacterium]
MAMPTLRRDWTVDDLLDLPDDGNRYEVLDGELLVTPAPSLDHQRAVFELSRLLSDYLAKHSVGEAIISPADVTFSARRLVQPDVFVMPFTETGGKASRFTDVGRLVLAIEILSPSTARADRVKKRRVYREQGVPEYWIVDLDARTIERSMPADDRVDVFAERLAWLPDGATSALEIDVAEYFRAALD